MSTNEDVLKEKMVINMNDHTRPIRISYAKIFEKEKNDLSGNMEYSAMFLIDKTDKKMVQQVKDAINSAISLKWGTNQPAGIRIPLRDGDQSGPTGVPSGASPEKRLTAVITLSMLKTQPTLALLYGIRKVR